MGSGTRAPMTGAEWFGLIVMTVLVSPVFGACGALIGALATGASSIGMIVGAVASIVFAFFFIKSLRGYRTKKQRLQDEAEELLRLQLERARELRDSDKSRVDLENEEIRQYLLGQIRRDKS